MPGMEENIEWLPLTGIKGGGGFGTDDEEDDDDAEFRLEVGTGNPGRGDAPIVQNSRHQYITKHDTKTQHAIGY